MALREPIVMNNWQQGISPSFYNGFTDLRNADVMSQPGILREAYRTDSCSNVVDALIKWSVKDPISGKDYAIDENGQVYRRDNFGSSTDWLELTMSTQANASGNGLAIWKDYLIVARDSKIDTYGPLNNQATAATWNAGAASLTEVLDWHPILASEDDKLYIGNKNSIVRWTESGTFDGTTGTVSSATVGTLQSEVVIKCMTDFTKRFIAVGIKGNNNVPAQAQLFAYDRTTTFMEERVDLKEDGVNSLLAVGTTLYVQAGTTGNLYTTNFSKFQLLRSFEQLQVVQIGSLDADYVQRPSMVIYPDAMKYVDGEIVFGLSYGTGGSRPKGLGIYGLKNGRLYHKATVSDDNDGTDGIVRIGSIMPQGNQGDFYFGWESNGSFGIDGVNLLGNFYAAYKTYARSQFYIVGDTKSPHSFSHVQFLFAEPPSGSQGIKIKYRNTKTADFTTAGFWTVDEATGSKALGTNHYAEFPLPIAQERIVQFQIEINGVQLIEARVR